MVKSKDESWTSIIVYLMMGEFLPYEDVDGELKAQFDDLVAEIHNIQGEENIMLLTERIILEVTANPLLAKIFVAEDRSSLLMEVCTEPYGDYSHPLIKFLIEAHPYALLWVGDECPIYAIAGDPTHCVLMPYIAENYPWVLDHEQCIKKPPVHTLIRMYSYREREGAIGGIKCTADTIKRFFWAYPQAHQQANQITLVRQVVRPIEGDTIGIMSALETPIPTGGGHPLHMILKGRRECEFHLFKWLAEQCPDGMLKTDCEGKTPLHFACLALIRHRGSMTSLQICKYIIKNCPVSVRVAGSREELPIHYLLRHCHHRSVLEVVILLLREYPESFDIEGANYPAPKSIPFVQRVMPYLNEERELKKNANGLKEISGTFKVAVDEASTNKKAGLVGSAHNVFNSWATSCIQGLDLKKERISKNLQGLCDEFHVDDGRRRL